MASGKSGYVEYRSSVSWGTVRVYYSETYEVSTNRSTVTITSIRVKSTNWYGVTYYPDGILKINGTEVASFASNLGTVLVRIDAQNDWYQLVDATDTSKVITASLRDIEHNDDGSKSIDIELTGNRFDNFAFITASGKYGSGWSVNDSATIELTTIPRASTIGATAANIGEVSTLTVTRKASTFTHSIQYKFGNITGYIKADGSVQSSEVKIAALSIAFTVPTSFYAEIPNAASGTCTLTITTYSESAQVGDAQTTTFKVTTSKGACAPTVSGEVYDVLTDTVALTGDEHVLVRYCSEAACKITATAKNSASIKSMSIGGTTVTEDTLHIPNIETNIIKFSATDSRGYTTTVSVECVVVDYIKLTNNVQFTRDDPTSGKATLTIWGDYFNGNFGAEDNGLFIEYQLKQANGSYDDYQAAEFVVEGNAYKAVIALEGLDYEYSYTAQVVVRDALSTVTKTATISQGIPVFDWGEKDFRFNFALLCTANSYGDTLPTENLKRGQIFFLKNNVAGFTIRIYNGSTWM